MCTFLGNEERGSSPKYWQDSSNDMHGLLVAVMGGLTADNPVDGTSRDL